MKMQYTTSFSTARRSDLLRFACLCLLVIGACGGISAGLRTETLALPLSQVVQKREAPKRTPNPPQALSAQERRDAEQRLADLGYWVGKIDGQWDDLSRQALIAFQKIEGRRPTGQLTR